MLNSFMVSPILTNICLIIINSQSISPNKKKSMISNKPDKS